MHTYYTLHADNMWSLFYIGNDENRVGGWVEEEHGLLCGYWSSIRYGKNMSAGCEEAEINIHQKKKNTFNIWVLRLVVYKTYMGVAAVVSPAKEYQTQEHSTQMEIICRNGWGVAARQKKKNH